MKRVSSAGDRGHLFTPKRRLCFTLTLLLDFKPFSEKEYISCVVFFPPSGCLDRALAF